MYLVETFGRNSSHVFIFKQKTSYEMRISDWSSDVCSSDRSAQFVEQLIILIRLDQIAVDTQRLRTLTVLFAGTRGDHDDRRGADACGVTHVRGHLEAVCARHLDVEQNRSEEHTSELQSLMRISYAVFCLKKKTHIVLNHNHATALVIKNVLDHNKHRI